MEALDKMTRWHGHRHQLGSSTIRWVPCRETTQEPLSFSTLCPNQIEIKRLTAKPVTRNQTRYSSRETSSHLFQRKTNKICLQNLVKEVSAYRTLLNWLTGCPYLRTTAGLSMHSATRDFSQQILSLNSARWTCKTRRLISSRRVQKFMATARGGNSYQILATKGKGTFRSWCRLTLETSTTEGDNSWTRPRLTTMIRAQRWINSLQFSQEWG